MTQSDLSDLIALKMKIYPNSPEMAIDKLQNNVTLLPFPFSLRTSKILKTFFSFYFFPLVLTFKMLFNTNIASKVLRSTANGKTTAKIGWEKIFT